VKGANETDAHSDGGAPAATDDGNGLSGADAVGQVAATAPPARESPAGAGYEPRVAANRPTATLPS
jgi:hypothetical protein